MCALGYCENCREPLPYPFVEYVHNLGEPEQRTVRFCDPGCLGLWADREGACGALDMARALEASRLSRRLAESLELADGDPVRTYLHQVERQLQVKRARQESRRLLHRERPGTRAGKRV